MQMLHSTPLTKVFDIETTCKAQLRASHKRISNCSLAINKCCYSAL